MNSNEETTIQLQRLNEAIWGLGDILKTLTECLKVFADKTHEWYEAEKNRKVEECE